MQLQMSRAEKKGLFKTKYILNVHLILTPEERELLKRHKLADFEVFNAQEDWGPPHIFLITAGGYISKGPSAIECDTVNHLAILEDRIQSNCRNLAGQLKSLDGAFDGGTRTISFDE